MQIAVLSDIHGNSAALRALLNELPRYRVEKIFILGDIVGYYYHPDQVIEMLEDWPCELIGGNHEIMLRRLIQDGELPRNIRRKYGSGLETAVAKLNSLWKSRLCNLPESKVISVDGLRILLCHGAPWDVNYYIYPDASADILERCASLGFDFIFAGHTHYPFSWCNSSTFIANPGSVGQARDRGGFANWILFNTNNRTIVFHKTPYDVSSVAAEVRNIDPDIPYLYQVLMRKI